MNDKPTLKATQHKLTPRRGRRVLVATAALVLGLSSVALAVTIKGSSGPDTLFGTPDADRIQSYGGEDKIDPHEGDDKAYGGPDADRITERYGGVSPGGGNDLFAGGGGNDFLADYAGGSDTLQGNDGADDIQDSFDDPPASDLLQGGGGDDYLAVLAGESLGTGVDVLEGGSGDDILRADEGFGDDRIDGGRGTDWCYGDPGDQFISCEGTNLR